MEIFTNQTKRWRRATFGEWATPRNFGLMQQDLLSSRPGKPSVRKFLFNPEARTPHRPTNHVGYALMVAKKLYAVAEEKRFEGRIRVRNTRTNDIVLPEIL